MAVLSWLAAAVRKVPAPVRWLCALNLCLLVGFSMLAPTWRSPDEPNHADLIVGLREDWHYPAYDARDIDPGIRGSFALVLFSRGSKNLLAGEALPRSERPSREDLRAAGDAVDLGVMGRPGVANHMSQHPPGYYGLMAVLAEGVDRVMPGEGLGSYDRELSVLRLLSLLVAVPLPLVAWWVASVVGVDRSAGLAAAVATLAIPQLTHISSVVNSDALTVLLFGIITGLLVKVGRGDLGPRTVVGLGAATGALFFVKGSAFAVPLWTGAAVAVAALRLAASMRRRGTGWNEARSRLREALHERRTWLVGLGYAVTVGLGGWWWVANQLAYGHYAPTIELSTRLSGALVRPAGFEPSFGEWFELWGGPVLRRYWGEFGWIDIAIPQVAVNVASLWVVVGIVAVLSVIVVRREPAPRLDLGTVGLLLLPTLLLAAFFGGKSYNLYKIGGYMAGVQGRYMFGGVVGLAVVVAAGWQRITRRWTPLVFLGAGALLQLLAVRAMLGRWWGTPDASLRERIDAAATWSPWPAEALALGGVLAAAVGVLTVGSLVREALVAQPAGRGSDDGLVGELDEGDEVDRVGPEVGVVVGVGVDQVGPAVAE